MVGDPRNLSDLYRIEAQVRLTCASCKASEVWELTALIAEVRKNGGNTDWRTAPYALKCPRHCPAPLIKLVPLPYGKSRAKAREHRKVIVNLALQILRSAARRASAETVGTPEVRLALHVLRPYLRKSVFLAEYWKAATIEPRHPWTSCHLPYRWIAQRLIDLGVEVDDANKP